MNKSVLFIFTLSVFCVFATGCASVGMSIGGMSTTEIVTQFRKIDYSDGINAKEAKAIAYEYMFRHGLTRKYGESFTCVSGGKKNSSWQFSAKPNLDNLVVAYSSRELWIDINSKTGKIEKVVETSRFGARNYPID